jgi:hypothetical protein
VDREFFAGSHSFVEARDRDTVVKETAVAEDRGQSRMGATKLRQELTNGRALGGDRPRQRTRSDGGPGGREEEHPYPTRR